MTQTKIKVTANEYLLGIKLNLEQTQEECESIIKRVSKLENNLTSFKECGNLTMEVFHQRLGEIVESEKTTLMYLNFAQKRLSKMIDKMGENKE